MKKVLGAVIIAAVLVVCLGARGIMQINDDPVQTEDTVTMYSEDGRVEEFSRSEAEAQKTVGWYENFTDVLTTMWREDGSSILVFKADVSEYKAQGYTDDYESLFTTVYNPDTDEEADVLKIDVQSYVDRGWKRGGKDVDPDKPMVCLTFDDGPSSENTSRLLDILEENNARATFFMLGSQIEKVKDAESILTRMKELGCDTASHTYGHTQLTSLASIDDVKKEFEDTDNAIRNITGETASSMRPPYGAYNDNVKSVAKEKDEPIVLWSIDTLDWKTKNPDSIYSEVMGKVSDGDIILMHDIYSTTVDAVERIVPALQEAGYQLVTVSEMGDAKIGGLKAGEVYTDLWKSTVNKLSANDEN